MSVEKNAVLIDKGKMVGGTLGGSVVSVNKNYPDRKGNVEIRKVPFSENLMSIDNQEEFSNYLYRTSGGSTDIETGHANISFVRGNVNIKGKVDEVIEATYNSTYTPDPEEEFNYPTVDVTADTWRNSTYGATTGDYTFNYDGTNWNYDSTAVTLTDIGLDVTGDVNSGDTIVVHYVKANLGTICTIKPISFSATGLNLFDNTSMILTGYTIGADGVITASSGSYVAYVKAPYSDEAGYIAHDSFGSITRMGYLDKVPEAGDTVDLTYQTLGTIMSTCKVPDTSINDATGFICVACTSVEALCIHPRWTGTHDTDEEAFALSTIDFPTTDTLGNDLPYIAYGLPAVGDVADEINFDFYKYIQRIGHYAYSAENLATVEALGVDYIYDSNHIFYVLANPVNISFDNTYDGIYTVNDFGTEYFLYTVGVGESNGVLAHVNHLYGRNLVDKLRRDVVTISEQTLTAEQQAQVLANIGAASAASVTQLNNDLYNNAYNLNNIYRGENLGTLTSGNVDEFLAELDIGGDYNIRLGDYFEIHDGIHNTYWMVAGINNYSAKSITNGTNHITLIPRDILKFPQNTSDNYCSMNSTATTGVSKNTSNPLYNTTSGNETAGYQAYYGSDMCQIYLPAIVNNLQQVLGNHLLLQAAYTSDTMNLTASTGVWNESGTTEFKGLAVNWRQYDCYAILPGELEFYGTKLYSRGIIDVGRQTQQLPIFKMIPINLFSSTGCWFNSPISSTAFANMGGSGTPGYYNANTRLAIRPIICIK